MTKFFIKNVSKYIIIFIVLIIIFVSLLFLSCMIPRQSIFDKVKESSDILFNEGNDLLVESITEKENIKLDNYSDALIINTVYSIDENTPLYSAFTAKKNYIPGITKVIYKDMLKELKSSSKYEKYNPVGELNDTVNGEATEAFEYTRYWHGYMSVIRPMLVFFNIMQIRITMVIILDILLIIFLILLSRKINIISAFITFITLVCIDYLYIGLSLQGCFVFFITIISCIIILFKNGNIKNLGLTFFIIGSVTNFFDFLTNPLLTLGFPILMYFLIVQKKEELNIKNILKIFANTCIFWVLGYAVTWLTKWILVDILYQKNTINIAVSQIKYRSQSGGTSSFFSAFKFNLFMIKNCFAGLTLINILYITLVLIYKCYSKSENDKLQNINLKQNFIVALPYLIISIMPFCWYLAVNNHSRLHYFFTFRNLSLTVVSFQIFLIKLFGIFDFKFKLNKKSSIK